MRSHKLYLEDIKTSLDKIKKYASTVPAAKFADDEKTVDAIIRNLEIIGEAVKSPPDFIKEAHPEIDWKAIVGMRNIVIHEYFGVDIDELKKTIEEDIPYLDSASKKILGSLT